MGRWLVKLNFNSPLHLGKAGIGMEAVDNFVRSDTLFGALCHAWASVYGSYSVTELLDGFNNGEPSFKISSAFPFKGDTFFLPRPQVAARLADAADGQRIFKELHRLSFVPLDMFKQWVAGKAVDPGAILPAKEILVSAMTYHRVPRVQLDRVTSASGLFHAGMMVFANEAGLYCLVDVEESTLRDKLAGVFAWLGENGLGGLRTTGYGNFDPQWEAAGPEWDGLWENSSDAEAWCLLSLAYPAPAERNNNLDGAYFEIITRAGWAASPETIRQVRRKSCKMFAEGSVLPYLPAGCMADVTPANWDRGTHPLYRYGYAMSVPVEVNR